MKTLNSYIKESLTSATTIYCSKDFDMNNIRAFVFQSCVAEEIVMNTLSKDWNSLVKTNGSASGVQDQKKHSDIIGKYDGTTYHIDVKTPYVKGKTVPVTKAETLAIVYENTVYVANYSDLDVNGKNVDLDNFINNAFYSCELSSKDASTYNKYFNKMISISDESWRTSQGEDVLLGLLDEMAKSFGLKVKFVVV